MFWGGHASIRGVLDSVSFLPRPMLVHRGADFSAIVRQE